MINPSWDFVYSHGFFSSQTKLIYCASLPLHSNIHTYWRNLYVNRVSTEKNFSGSGDFELSYQPGKLRAAACFASLQQCCSGFKTGPFICPETGLCSPQSLVRQKLELGSLAVARKLKTQSVLMNPFSEFVWESWPSHCCEPHDEIIADCLTICWALQTTGEDLARA